MPSYTLAELQKISPQIPSNKVNGGLQTLMQSDWYCVDETTDHQLYRDLVQGQGQAAGQPFSRIGASLLIDQPEFERQLKLRLQRKDEDDQTFFGELGRLKRHWNQSVFGGFRTIITQPLLEHNLIVQSSHTTNLGRDERGFYVDATLRDIIFSKDTVTETRQSTLPGMIAYRFRLTDGDEKGFRLENLSMTTSLLRDLCFYKSVASNRLPVGKKIDTELNRKIESLKKALEEPTVASNLKDKGVRVVEALEREAASSNADFRTLKDITDQTKALIKNPVAADLNKYVTTAEMLPKKRSWKRILAGAMIILAGAVLITASVMVACATFGVATPLSAMGIVVSASIITAGVACAAAGLGVVGVVAGGLFANSKVITSVVPATKELAQEVASMRSTGLTP